MNTRKKDFFAIHSQSIELYLAGERESPFICSTPGVVRNLERRYNVILQKERVVREDLGLSIYRII